MAKKVLTPEEVKAKMEKKSAKRKLFFGTFTKALAFFLAIAIAYSLATIAFTPVTAPAGTTVQGDTQDGGTSTDDGGEDFGGAFDDSGSSSTGDSGSSSTGDSGSSSTGDSGSSSTGDSGSSSTGDSGSSGNSGSSMSKDEQKKLVADAMNTATAKAAKGNYEMERVCKYQSGKGIKVTMFGGDATSVLNGAITAVDENASLDSVVGGFLGIGTKKIKVTNGVGQRCNDDGSMSDLSNEEKDYMLKAMNLSASDISNVNISADGNVYTFAIAKIADPQKDGKNSMHKATNDFITETQVKTAIGSLTDAIKVESANVSYNSILFVATMENGNLKKLTMSYKADAKMKLKVGVAIDGSGSMEVNTVYNF